MWMRHHVSFAIAAFSTFSVSIFALPTLHGGEFHCSIVPTQLRCEYRSNPLNIDVSRPRLSWILWATDTNARGQKQTAYRILVASDKELLAKDQGDLWDSNKIDSNTTIQVEYAGRPLTSRMQCHWKVRVWDESGKASAWSEPATWEMSLMRPEDWLARWINDGYAVPMQDADFFEDDPAPLLRKTFDVEKPVRRARLYVSGLGYAYARLNGHAVGDRVLDPAWTNYAKRVLYSTHDVTSQIVPGRNCVGLTLGNGWYNPLPLKMWGFLNLREHLSVGRPRAVAQLEIEFADGTRQVVATDETWRVAPGPILRNNIYLGEVYDARRETAGWDESDFDDATWVNAVLAEEPVGALQAQMLPPIRITGHLKPVARTEPKSGVFIFDMGQNFAGWARLHVCGPAGTVVKLRFGELLHPDGMLNVMTSVCGQIKNGKENRNGEYPQLAYQSDIYVLSGKGNEVHTPHFTWHGFRYVEVTGYPGTPGIDAIEGLRLSADVDEVGTFTCSNERFNQIQQMVRWTFLSNLFSVQSDCPARERFGYGGDLVATSEAFMFNFDMAAFYEKVTQDFADTVNATGSLASTAPSVGFQNTDAFRGQVVAIGWQLAFPEIQNQLYRYYGDLRVIRDQYPTARRQLEYLRTKAKNHIVVDCIGDHETIELTGSHIDPSGHHRQPKSVALTSTAFYYHQAKMVAKFAKLLGNKEDALKYQELAEQIRNVFIAKFFHADTGRFELGTQACQSFALHYDLLPPKSGQAVVNVLLGEVQRHDGHLSTGIFGTRYLLEVLSRARHADVAYSIVDQKGFPGWRNMLDHGATTLWEHWDFSDNVFSHNHPMFGSLSTWFFEDIGGIHANEDAVGFSRITIQPQIVGKLTHGNAQYKSIRGLVSCQWRLDGDQLRMNVTVPPNITATVYVPTIDPNSVKESDRPVGEAPGLRPKPSENGAAVFGIGGGRYRFDSKFK